MNIDGLNIPDSWVEKLTEIQKDDPKAIIAGGCIRDLSFGRVPKDIDIFASCMPSTWEIDNSRVHNEDYEGMSYVVAIGEFKGPLPINVIVLEDCPSHMALLKSFDFGICQIGFDGSQIIKTSEFDWDSKYGVMTLRHIDRYQRSICRYARWFPKYGWNIVIPEIETKEPF